MRPRGTGTVSPPSQDCTRKALTHLVHGSLQEPDMGLELEKLRGICEQRHKNLEGMQWHHESASWPVGVRARQTATLLGFEHGLLG
jgi:hypothetical protein